MKYLTSHTIPSLTLSRSHKPRKASLPGHSSPSSYYFSSPSSYYFSSSSYYYYYYYYYYYHQHCQC